GGVLHVVLFAARHAIKQDAEEAEILRAIALTQQGAEHGIAVEARHAGPDDFALFVDQRADAAVADESEIQITHISSFQSCCASSGIQPSQPRTASTSARRYCAQVRPLPTLIDSPPILLTTLKPCSSVRSSPMKTGRRPAKGGMAMSAPIAVPLSKPPGLSSNTYLPRCTCRSGCRASTPLSSRLR